LLGRLCNFFQRTSSLSLFSKRGAKVMTFSYYFQISSEVFAFIIFYCRISLDCGCKGRHFYITCQIFCQLFCEKF
ncbi:hypothetical protein B5F77_02295, partial [Parabacteroides sp. An277]